MITYHIKSTTNDCPRFNNRTWIYESEQIGKTALDCLQKHLSKLVYCSTFYGHVGPVTKQVAFELFLAHHLKNIRLQSRPRWLRLEPCADDIFQHEFQIL